MVFQPLWQLQGSGTSQKSCAVVGRSRWGGTDFISQHTLCSQNSPLPSALAASSGPASIKQEISARILYKSKVLKTCRLPILWGVKSWGGKILREDAFEDVVSEGVQKTHHTIRS